MIRLEKLETNLHTVELPNNTLYFSYETIVAYTNHADDELVISENIWSRTTAKHLSRIKKHWYGRVDVLRNDDFNSRLYHDIN